FTNDLKTSTNGLKTFTNDLKTSTNGLKTFTNDSKTFTNDLKKLKFHLFPISNHSILLIKCKIRYFALFWHFSKAKPENLNNMIFLSYYSI
ncbi:MAG: hypothetical protein WCH34_07935, partial [Bacteroidota bacterium]